MAGGSLHPDVLVIGLGAMGSATLLHVAATGANVIGVDQHSPPHPFGSSHGESRITRQAVGEGAAFVPLVLRSHQLWRDLEAESDIRVLHECGGLILARSGQASHMHAEPDFLGQTIALARQFGIAHEVWDATRIGARFPQFSLQGDETGYFEPGAGYLNPEACIRTQLQMAARRGARIHTQERVLSIRRQGQSTVVQTDRARYTPGTVIVTAGPWLPSLMPDAVRTRLRVQRQVLYWFSPGDAGGFSPAAFPVFIWHWGNGPDDVFYGFPDLGGGVKVATEQTAKETNPDNVERQVSTAEVATMFDTHIRSRLPGLDSQLMSSATCLYTATPDARFVIGRPAGWPSTIVVSACSGHGFKHSAAIGEAVADMALSGKTPAVLAPFGAGLIS